MFPSSTKREIRHFHDVVLQRRQGNVQKTVMHVQSCWSKPIAFLLFPLPSSLLKLPIYGRRTSRFQSSFLLIHFRYGPNTRSLQTKVYHRKVYPICDAPLSGSVRAASLRYKNRAKITVLTREQKSYQVWFSCPCKIYRVQRVWFLLLVGRYYKTLNKWTERKN